jgi:hypothetical protein
MCLSVLLNLVPFLIRIERHKLPFVLFIYVKKHWITK